MKSLRLNNHGCHGLIGESLTPQFAIRYGNAIGTYFEKGKLLLAGDPRASTPMLRSALTSSLLSCGIDVVDIGICPQPVVQFAISQDPELQGGIYISAGNSDASWNGLMVFQSDGTIFNQFCGSELLGIYHSHQFNKQSWENLGKIYYQEAPIQAYLDHLLQHVDIEAIKKRAPTIVIDTCNGACPQIVSEIAQRLGIKLIALNNIANGIFPHDPEPRPRNSQQVASILTSIHADLGFCINSNGATCAVITNIGERVSEEFTFALVAETLLRHKKITGIATTLSTSRMIDDLADSHHIRLKKTEAGGGSEIINTMRTEGFNLGGEGNGAVCFAEHGYFYDALFTIVTLIEAICIEQVTCNDLIQRIPIRYHLVKHNISIEGTKQYVIIDRIRNLLKNEKCTTSIDGIRVEWLDGWIHLRASSSRPVLRLISESRTLEQAHHRADMIMQYITANV